MPSSELERPCSFAERFRTGEQGRPLIVEGSGCLSAPPIRVE